MTNAWGDGVDDEITLEDDFNFTKSVEEIIETFDKLLGESEIPEKLQEELDELERMKEAQKNP